MTDRSNLISEALKGFMSEAPECAQAWGSAIQGLAIARAWAAKGTVG